MVLSACLGGPSQQVYSQSTSAVPVNQRITRQPVQSQSTNVFPVSQCNPSQPTYFLTYFLSTNVFPVYQCIPSLPVQSQSTSASVGLSSDSGEASVHISSTVSLMWLSSPIRGWSVPFRYRTAPQDGRNRKEQPPRPIEDESIAVCPVKLGSRSGEVPWRKESATGLA